MKIFAMGHLVKTNPIQTQSNPIAERVKLMQSVYLQRITEKTTISQSEKTNPIPEKPKMNVNAFLQKDYENEPPSGSEKTNPNKACPERSRMGQFQTGASAN
jgi:hypothetical protein